jgi:hypothetical protein
MKMDTNVDVDRALQGGTNTYMDKERKATTNTNTKRYTNMYT